MRTQTKLEKKEDEENLRKNPVNDFCCLECKDAQPMVYEEFKHHLFKVHKLKSDQLKGKKQMLMHMDGDYWFSSSYEWTLEYGLKFSQHCKNARMADDPMRFEH